MRASPPAFMDRAMLTGNPHKVLEGPDHRRLCHRRAAGLHLHPARLRRRWPCTSRRRSPRRRNTAFLARTSLGSGFDFTVELHLRRRHLRLRRILRLMRSIEGNAPEPRPKYIRTSVSGIWTSLPSQQRRNLGQRARDHQPRRGLVHQHRLRKEQGDKLVSLSGHVVNSGVVEDAMGTPLRTIVSTSAVACPMAKRPKP